MASSSQAIMIDVSHTIEHGMITYRGLPAPIICDYLSREESKSHYDNKAEFHIGKIEMVANTGTYLDSPFHRYADGKDLSALSLESIASVDGILITIKHSRRAIEKKDFEGFDVTNKAVLIQTGWSKHWRTDQYFEQHPFLTREGAQYLADQKVRIVGIDSLNIDDTTDAERPAHSILLKNDIPIVEHMTNLGQVSDHLHQSDKTSFKFFAVPAKVKDFGTWPVRAFVSL
mmetsp:Transcript_4074/g.5709  ORF Transcript_4074/g.5709 Transcript_4074/m.5709 type:complete len:230 (+) Transcript_4074:33-722(+)